MKMRFGKWTAKVVAGFTYKGRSMSGADVRLDGHRRNLSFTIGLADGVRRAERRCHTLYAVKVPVFENSTVDVITEGSSTGPPDDSQKTH